MSPDAAEDDNIPDAPADEKSVEYFGNVHRKYHKQKLPNGRRLDVIYTRPHAPGLAGEFFFLSTGGAGIKIYERTPLRHRFRTFLILCHEVGHALSWVRGTRPSGYEKICDVSLLPALDSASKQLVIAEEIRAWRNGFEVAGEAGFDDQALFCRVADRALGYYYRTLNLPVTPLTLA